MEIENRERWSVPRDGQCDTQGPSKRGNNVMFRAQQKGQIKSIGAWKGQIAQGKESSGFESSFLASGKSTILTAVPAWSKPPVFNDLIFVIN